MKTNDNKIEFDSMIFYKSFMDVADNLEKAEEYRTFMQYILHYAMRGEEPKPSKEHCYNLFLLVKPQIDKNLKRRINGIVNGSKGGRPPKSKDNIETNTTTEPPPKKQQEENINIKSSYGRYKRVWLSVQEVEELKKIYDTTQINTYINKVDEYKERTGKEYKSDYLTIVKWITEDKDKTKTKVSENSFNKFEQHEYNYDELEKQLLSN